MTTAKDWISPQKESPLTFSLRDEMIKVSLCLRLVNVLVEDPWEFVKSVKRKCRIRKLGPVKRVLLSNTLTAQVFPLFRTIPKRFICRDGIVVPIAMWRRAESIILIVIRNTARNAEDS
jgi:hypothetical protein